MPEKSHGPGSNQTNSTDDLLSIWKKAYDFNEDIWTKYWENVLTTETYASMMGISNKQMMLFIDIMKKNTTNLLSFNNIPSRDDLASTTKRIVAVEEKVDDLSFMLDDVVDNVKQSLVQEISELSNQLKKLRAAIADFPAAVDLATNSPASSAGGISGKTKRKRSAARPNEANVEPADSDGPDHSDLG